MPLPRVAAHSTSKGPPDMSKKTIKPRYGKIEINDGYGTPMAISLDNEERCIATPITVDEARELARALNAFAEIHY